jgi:hypothetical protein
MITLVILFNSGKLIAYLPPGSTGFYESYTNLESIRFTSVNNNNIEEVKRLDKLNELHRSMSDLFINLLKFNSFTNSLLIEQINASINKKEKIESFAITTEIDSIYNSINDSNKFNADIYWFYIVKYLPDIDKLIIGFNAHYNGLPKFIGDLDKLELLVVL